MELLQSGGRIREQGTSSHVDQVSTSGSFSGQTEREQWQAGGGKNEFFGQTSGLRQGQHQRDEFLGCFAVLVQTYSAIAGRGRREYFGKSRPNKCAAKTPFETAVKVKNLDIAASGFIDAASGIAGLANFDGTLNSNGSQANAIGTFTGTKLRFSPKGSPSPNLHGDDPPSGFCQPQSLLRLARYPADHLIIAITLTTGSER
jgi:hypothetical protein